MEKSEKVQVSSIFNSEYTYSIPIYQRKYAWEKLHIDTLLSDIYEIEAKEYYLGTLIVQRKDNNEYEYEVVDGQQRLTTLYLLQKYLIEDDTNKEVLKFPAREKYTKTLKSIKEYASGNKCVSDEEKKSIAQEVISGYKIIEGYFQGDKDKKEKIKENLEKMYLLRVEVPQDVDLNHYFERMHTRGEQLEPHHILKARLLSRISDTRDKEVATLIWDCCENMECHVQENFSIGLENDNDSEKELLNILEEAQRTEESISTNENSTEEKNNKNNEEEDDDNDGRFKSILSFPNFLLQVLAVFVLLKGGNATNVLDDKKLILLFEIYLLKNKDKEIEIKSFFELMLKCRVLFDKYILKQEDSEQSEWSLKKFVKKEREKEGKVPINAKDIEQLIVLQSVLRITYSSPSQMGWITEVLWALCKREDTTEEAIIENLISILENYCRRKVKESYDKNAIHPNINRIQFTYLDYILYRDEHDEGGKPKYRKEAFFHYRTSIEHLYPRVPENGQYWEEQDLNNFGNLALITVSDNSKFSNAFPKDKFEKIETSKKKSKEEKQSPSPKLIKMLEYFKKNNEEWTPERAREHGKEMLVLLEKDINEYVELRRKQ